MAMMKAFFLPNAIIILKSIIGSFVANTPARPPLFQPSDNLHSWDAKLQLPPYSHKSKSPRFLFPLHEDDENPGIRFICFSKPAKQPH
ncbi:hypothetical protein PtrSN002B_009654 [Pyrenophora tritici-repentis]|nr:hypothetical protein Alg130_10015 [Pyrenophora tritici-repentis]KAI0583839.1 hypothetical protein Alg215_03367 [Pyrenophora tritici-repentis]KAI0605811.1 hypothetical protein TUN205_09946 [Pyrenophora tritici-repentis]KAI1533187.1 hypothetical protein PtrSN001C_007679 [Pyrenophora tritici-repentis]KAI1536353.1 hypothetical protein PtrSN002B_009654 [Pyrenophora tritici-repentis]